LRVHLVVDFEGAGGEHFEEGLAVVVDVDRIAEGEGVFLVVDLSGEGGTWK
jgi:hypothetical protein